MPTTHPGGHPRHTFLKPQEVIARYRWGHPRPPRHDSGIDPVTEFAEGPAGLLHHLGAGGAAGNLVVMEVWDTQESQMANMSSRLGPALDKAGIPDPTRVEWLSVVGEHHTT